MDNLNVHHDPLVIQAIHNFGYRIVFRTPYYPVDGPIELVFITYEGQLRKRMFQIHSDDDLVRVTDDIFRSFGPFRPFFHIVGLR